MPDTEPQSISPSGYVWNLHNGRRREDRVYEQSEVSIEGEARLIGLGRKMGAVLADAGYTYGQLGELFDEQQDVDWDKAMTLIASVAEHAPDLIAEAATVFLSIYPTNEDGTPNEKYLDEVSFLRGALKLATFADMVRLFAYQNEYSRLVAPFSETLAETMAAFGGPVGEPAAASSGSSAQPGIVSLDGSTIAIDPLSVTPTSGEAPPSEPEWQSKDSPRPTSSRTRAPRKSAPETRPAD